MFSFARRLIWGPAPTAFSEAKYTVPPEWRKDASDDLIYTPDADEVESKTHRLLFVYNEMQGGHRANGFLSEAAEYRAIAYTRLNNQFSLWKRRTGYYYEPFMLETPMKKAPLARVRGELWKVKSTFFADKLDRYMQNGVYFHRIRIPIIIIHKDVIRANTVKGPRTYLSPEKWSQLSAYTYVGNPDYWIPQLDGGFSFEPVTLYHRGSAVFKGSHSKDLQLPEREWLGEHYYFSLAEADDIPF